MTRFTYRHLVTLLEGDQDMIEQLVEHGVIERGEGDRVTVDVDRVLVARTLRELEVEWPGIEVILRLRDDLSHARRRIADLEHAVAELRRRR